VAVALWAAGAGCGTALSVSPAPGGAPQGARGPVAPAPDVSEAALPASEREAVLGRIAAMLEDAGLDKNAHSSALLELERYLAGHPDEPRDAALALLGRLLGDFVKCAENLAEAEQRVGDAGLAASRLQERADAAARQNASLAAELEKVKRERGELKALVQRLKDLELNMEEKRKRLR
jgi:predicted O-linked N-acetylglucosamine transferase (SPINDLY family)